MYKYSILCYIFNNYDVLHEPDEIDPECHYICVTDNPNLKSNIWNIKYINYFKKLSPFDKCYQVRFNLFNYVDTNICIYIDASIKIKKSLKLLYNIFVNSNADLAVQLHPERCNLIDEYFAWIKLRDYPQKQAIKCLQYLKNNNYNFNNKGLIQGTIRICKNTKLNNSIDSLTLKTLRKLGKNNIIERIDQTIYTYVLQTYFNDIKILPLSQQVIQSNYMVKYYHNSFTKIYNPYIYLNNQEFLNNKLVDVIKL